MMAGNCSQCGNNGHTSRTCEASEGGFMLFGVRVTQGPIQKSASMNNLAQYDHPAHADVASGYASDDVVHTGSARNRERKRGTRALFSPLSLSHTHTVTYTRVSFGTGVVDPKLFGRDQPQMNSGQCSNYR